MAGFRALPETGHVIVFFLSLDSNPIIPKTVSPYSKLSTLDLEF